MFELILLLKCDWLDILLGTRMCVLTYLFFLISWMSIEALIMVQVFVNQTGYHVPYLSAEV